jgi:hypothetical protein
MKNKGKKILALPLLILFSFFINAADKGSGTGCDPIQIRQQGYIKAVQLSSKLSAYLDRKAQAKVVLLARAGSNSPSKRFQKKISSYWNYTHAGLAYKNHPSGEWTVVHMLNDCGEKSSIYAESLMKFFLDDPFEYRTVVAIPSAAIQDSLETLIIERNMATALFNNSRYSSVSNPFNTQRQNSNEYILDTLTAAIALENGTNNIFTREQAKDYLHSAKLKQYVEPEQVKVKGLESFGMALGFGPKNATLEDHSRNERSNGSVNMVSAGTLIQFLDHTGHLISTTELALRNKTQAQDTVYKK